MKVIKIIKPEFYCKESKEFTIKQMKKNKFIRRAFKIFCELLPDHPSEENTKVYFLKMDDGIIDMFWVCTHFECCGKDYLVAISAFLNYLIDEFSNDCEGRLVYLDDNWEKIVLMVYNINSKPTLGVFKQKDWKVVEE